MSTQKLITQLILNNRLTKGTPKSKFNPLLSVLALSALSEQAFADAKLEVPETIEVKGYLVDLTKLLKEAGVSVSQIDKVTASLVESQSGEWVALGQGLFQFIPESVSVTEAPLLIKIIGAGLSQETIAKISFADAKAMHSDTSTMKVSDFDSASFSSSFPTLLSAREYTAAEKETGLRDSFSQSWNDFFNDLDDKNSEDASHTEINADFDMSSLGWALLGVGAAAGVAIVAGGGSSGSSASASAPDVEIGGVASHGTLKNAQVFLDANSDGDLDWTDGNDNDSWDAGEGEQWALTDADGSYTLTNVSAADKASGTLVVQSYTGPDSEGNDVSTLDTISGSAVENIVMKAAAASVEEGKVAMITPLTTLVEAGVSNDDVLEILGLDASIDIDTFNPFASLAELEGDALVAAEAKAVAFEKVASQVFTTLNTVAEAIEGAADGNIATNDIFSLAVEQMVKIVEAKVIVRDTLEAEVTALEAKVTAGTITAEEQTTLTATKTDVSDSVVSFTDAAVIQAIATETLTTVDTQIKTTKAKEITALEAKVTAGTITEVEQAALASKQTTVDQGISTANLEKVNATVEVISKAVTNINAAIDEITVFTRESAGDTLLQGAETLAAEAKKSVEDGNTNSMTLNADKLIREGQTSVTDDLAVTVTTVVSSKASDSGYGTYAVTAEGDWTYTLNSNHTTINALGIGATETDSFTVTTSGGAATVKITIIGSNDAPTLSGSTTGSVTEDAVDITATGTLTGSDVDAGDTQTYSVDETTGTYGSFAVSTGGVWTYTLDNADAQTTALTQGEVVTESFVVTVTDKARATASETVTITITGVNDAPVITSSASVDAPENGTAATIVTTTDAESDSIFYSIVSGTDADLFAIDSATGALTFKAAPDYELLDPVADDNVYTLTVNANDGTVDVPQDVTITVTNVEGGPVFSSAETVTVDENQTGVVTLTASDDENDVIAFTISGGDDAGSFTLTDGVLTFKAAPDYEVKSSYALTVTASETTDKDDVAIATPNTTEQAITVSINNINDAAVITASGASIAEGSATVTGTATHTDADASNADNTFTAVTDIAATYGTYSVSSAGLWTYTLNSDHVTIDALGTGQTETDTVTVTAEDGTTKAITITINGSNDAAVIGGASTGAVTEDALTTTASGTLTHTDVDTTDADNKFTAVSSATVSANGYGEYTVTEDGDWTYTLSNTNSTVDALAASAKTTDSFTATSTDGTAQIVTVTITGSNDAPVITSSASVDAPENGTAATIVTATDAESDSIFYSIVSGTDADLFAIDSATGALTFKAAPDYELLDPVADDNVYTLTVNANDGTVDVPQDVTITVTNVEGGPVFSSAETVTVDENQTGVVTLTASDDENDVIAFTISGGDDAGSFTLTDGVLTFKAAPDYEVKSSYALTVTASETTDKDDVAIATPNTTEQAITVSINNINDAAVITASGASIAEGSATVTGTATHTDEDGEHADNVFSALGNTGTYGTYTTAANGGWTYTLDNTNSAVNALGAGEELSDTVTLTAADLTEKDLTITITGVNDPAVITGTITGAVTEDHGTTTARATLTHTDVDASNADNLFKAVAAQTSSSKGYGTYEVTTGGVWEYTLVNLNSTVSALAADAKLEDTITVTADDGTDQSVTITITGANDAPVATDDNASTDASFTIPEDATAAVLAVLGNDTDAEGDTLTVTNALGASNGTTTVVNGVLSYTPTAHFSGTDSITYQVQDSSGATDSATATITVTSVNDPLTGSVTISGTTKTGQTLTAANTLADDDGLGAISYQWLKNGEIITGETNPTYVLADSDKGSTFAVKASYTDDGGTLETSTSDATSEVVDIDKPFMFTSEIITAEQASLDLYGEDYTTGSTEKIIKLILNVDMDGFADPTAVTSTDGNVEVINGILSGTLSVSSLDWSKVELFDYKYGGDASEKYKTLNLYDAYNFSSLTEYDGSQSVEQFNSISVTSLNADTDPMLTLVDNLTTKERGVVEHPSSSDLLAVYLNPVDSVTSLDMSYTTSITPSVGVTEVNSDFFVEQLTTIVSVDIV